MASLLRQLPTTLLILAFTITQLACLCAHGSDRPVRPTAQASHARACCAHEAATPTPSSTHSACPHCGDVKSSVIAADHSVATDVIAHQPAAYFDPGLTIASPSAVALDRRDVSFAHAHEPAPPPDVLRMTCSLLI